MPDAQQLEVEGAEDLRPGQATVAPAHRGAHPGDDDQPDEVIVRASVGDRLQF
jgi:hypothetical protein